MKKTYKRIVSLVLVFVMMFAFSANAVAAEVNTVKSVDEILAEYREKCRELETDNGVAWTASASTTRADLRAEVLNELAAAGYEAYSVNATNRTSVEAALKTDFDEIGLEPSGTYLVVVSGENGNTRTTAPGNSFSYTYGGETYTLRYLYVSADPHNSNDPYRKIEDVDLLNDAAGTTLLNYLSSALTLGTTAYDAIFGSNLGIISTMCDAVISVIEAHKNRISSSSLELRACVDWTREYTQVYEEYDLMWTYGTCVEIADCYSAIRGTYYDEVEKETTGSGWVDILRDNHYFTVKSGKYSDSNWKKQQAVLNYINGNPCTEKSTGNIEFYYKGDTVVTVENDLW